MIGVGAIVKFAEPQSDDETAERFVVKELRGERVLVEDIQSSAAIKPTFVYMLNDMKLAVEEA